ncbi:hypothetical protein FRB90_006392 [Tulasnella sp. 427]|nr:hypothetical protein FRB90_006392 [Tulasnella sp. 427]
MPKSIRKSSIRRHQNSARPVVRFADLSPEGSPRAEKQTTDSIDPTASGSEILAAITKAAETKSEVPTVRKKDKMKARHDAFVQRLESTSSPYARPNRSEGKRKKERKPNANLRFGMDDLNSALNSILTDDDGEEWEGLKTQPQHRKRPKIRKIGESDAKVTSAQMKRVLKEEQKRLPLIQQHPAFAADPFATIRLHAENTLVKHDRVKNKLQKADGR